MSETLFTSHECNLEMYYSGLKSGIKAVHVHTQVHVHFTVCTCALHSVYFTVCTSHVHTQAHVHFTVCTSHVHTQAHVHFTGVTYLQVITCWCFLICGVDL